MEKKSFKGLIKKAVVCVMCTLALAGGSIGLSGCITTVPKTPIKETKEVNISTTMNVPTEVEFVEVGNGKVKIVWNYQETENVKAEEGTKFSVKHEDGVSVVEKAEITVSKTVIDDAAVKIQTKAASSYAGADKVEEDKASNKEITTKTTYTFADSAEVSASYQKEEVKQKIQLKAPTNFEVTESGILKFAVDAKAKTFNLAITIEGKKEVFENQSVLEAESASFEIANYDKTKKYDFEVKLNGYETASATYLESSSSAFAKEAEQVQDMTFAEFEAIAADKIEIDNWHSYNIDKIFAIEKKSMDLRLIVQTSSGKEISYRIYKTTLPVNIEEMSLKNIVAEWEKDPKIVFASEANYTAANPALSETYKNHASLSSEVKSILNGGTILMESTSTPTGGSGSITSTMFIKYNGEVKKIAIYSLAIINHGDINKYMNEALAGTNRTGFTEKIETLSNAITASDSVEKVEMSAVQTFKVEKAVSKQVKPVCMEL